MRLTFTGPTCVGASCLHARTGRLRQKCVNLDRVRKTSETRLILTRIPTFAHRTPSARKDCSCQYHSQSPSFPTAVQIHVFLVQSPCLPKPENFVRTSRFY